MLALVFSRQSECSEDLENTSPVGGLNQLRVVRVVSAGIPDVPTTCRQLEYVIARTS